MAIVVDISRRTLIHGTGVIGATMLPIASPAQEGGGHNDASSTPSTAADARAAQQPTYLFFNSEEATFIEAAIARLIPKDDRWGGALEAGVANYIDKQLAGAWGTGERLYRSGPWQPGTPSQGYQLSFTPAELYRTALAAINKALAQTPFAQMSADRQDKYLASLEQGGTDLGGVPSDVFFSHVWQSTLEGFFSDPVYGGNHNMISWRMIGFPGAYASYYELVDKHGIKIDRPPMSLAEDANGHLLMDPGIPASSP
ncbi:gluconate 2-dehydrogenase subunit 3 family protein [Bradyrhizobium tropiciagri]|uniref:gluconate 2-dehydrogenase subunit 3 family protein n=1 Tax=Bradyrhizobium tropiciagri TaxID=312253 RepID=UPI001AEC252B|nr:gluconate 2-dehydrogenase subunit 3 family protein [Bradyrhizobium tropiciagri]